MSRDWQKDMELIKVGETSDIPYCISEFKNMLPYYHQQYAALEKEHAYAKQQAIMWNDKAVAEKERADKAEAREQKLREAIDKAIREYGLWHDEGSGANVMVEILHNAVSSLYPKEETK
ncbi:hypothetical protein J28TS4_04910 [Paenibacillus lautus]|uniref:hypothetical protein n=1 Tax=Paenibacillus lautus TaxID=1401 RepID=UPI001B11834A|nr:hypothetical protein [Paenibacillus lautus]GIP02084.1 hypothetical protein J28TS4_04910 [Paenibacillus lautus]